MEVWTEPPRVFFRLRFEGDLLQRDLAGIFMQVWETRPNPEELAALVVARLMALSGD